MHIRVRDQQRTQRILDPRVRAGGKGDECREEDDPPDLRDETREGALVDLLAEVGDGEDGADPDDLGGDREQVGVEGGEAEGFEGESEVGAGRGEGDVGGESHEVELEDESEEM